MNSGIREKMKNWRLSLDASYVERHSTKIIDQLRRNPAIMRSEHILCYHPMQNEVNLLPFCEELVKRGKTVYFPVAQLDNLIFFALEDMNDFAPGLFGVKEPTVRRLTFTPSSGTVLVPGIAFDKSGNRIGFGKAYYDHFLKNQTLLHKIGICYEQQLVDKIEPNPWDVRMDEMIYG